MNSKMAARMALLKRVAQHKPTENASKLRELVQTQLLVNLGNRNWGAVGLNQLNVSEGSKEIMPVGYSPDQASGQYNVNLDLSIPKNAPPYTDKKKYPGGLNQFKREMIDLIQRAAGPSVAVFITVNGV